MKDGHMAQCKPCIQILKKKERKRIKRKKRKEETECVGERERKGKNDFFASL